MMEERPQWFAVKLLFESVHSGEPNTEMMDEDDSDHKLFEESIILVRATSREEAQTFGEQQANKAEHSYHNKYGEMVEWHFVRILDIFQLNDDEIQSRTEVYARFLRESPFVPAEDVISWYYPEAADEKHGSIQPLNKTRNMIYVFENSLSKRFMYYGIEFHEWIRCINRHLDILLLQSEFTDGTRHQGTRLTYVPNDDMPKLLSDDIYHYGDFAWVDLNSVYSLDSLTPMELAELLYLAHTWKPLNSPFLFKIDNRFAYLAHDDGWLAHLYCRERNDFATLMSKVIPLKLKALHRVDVPDVSGSTLDGILSLMEQGLLIDFANVEQGANLLNIPMYVVGQFDDMDDLLNYQEDHV